MPQPKLTDNNIAQLVKDTKRILADSTGAPDPKFQAIDRKNSDQEALYDLWSKEPLITSPSQLADPGTFEKFNRLTSELVRIDNQEEAFKLSQLLDELLYKQNLSLRQRDPNLFVKYEKLLALCNYLSIISLNLNEIEILVKGYTAWAFSRGIDVRKKMDLVLRHYHDIMMDGAIAEKLGSALVFSKEYLGLNPIILSDGKNYPPTVGNWLTDYLQTSLNVADKQTGSYARSQYIFNNKNYKNLPTKEKTIVETLLKLYDWLKYGEGVVGEEEDITDEETGNDEYTNQQNLVLPKDFSLTDLPTSLEAAGEEAGQKPILPVAWKDASESPNQKPPLLPPLTPSPQKPRPVAPKPFKIEFEEPKLGKGLRMGNVDMKHEAGSMKQEKKSIPPVTLAPKSGINIDKKLEELKKKAQGKTINN